MHSHLIGSLVLDGMLSLLSSAILVEPSILLPVYMLQILGSLVHKQWCNDIGATAYILMLLSRSECVLNLHELLDPQQQEEDDIDPYELVESQQPQGEVEVDPPTPPPRSQRVWNFAEIHEIIRLQEESAYNPPTPPPPYHEAILKPRYETEENQAYRQPHDRYREETHDEQVAVLGYPLPVRYPNSSHTASTTPTLTQNPPPYHLLTRFSAAHLMQIQEVSYQSHSGARYVFEDVASLEGFEVRADVRDSTTGSRESDQEDNEGVDEDQLVQ
ncbi:hypothetical protein DE146DRAFT_626929 [Phaeosphaeria sp. MPI-PUGE-AT-0046c]|nr:hypothetical protein DE146DRAFT_626929 [Phaeosphaeria sp. MPI-PUGE-AT-0046c]